MIRGHPNYIGIRHYKNDKTKLLAVVMFEGDPELYQLDNMEALSELRRKYQDQYDRQPESISIFRQIG